MEESIEVALHKLGSYVPAEVGRRILLEFYRARTTEILTHLDDQGIGKILDENDIKIGGSI
jgi:hypothetical protein